MTKHICEYSARRIGKTTASAFYYIGEAMSYPGKELEVIDHHGTRMANNNLLKTIGTIIETLKLTGFHINITKGTFRYELQKDGES